MANTPLSCSKTCINCIKSGLAILPLRYAVVPQTMSNAMPSGIQGPGVMDITLSAHHYSLRTLREGWLYLFYEKGARGKNYWEAYKVTEDGRLWKQTIPLPSEPLTDPACAQVGGAVPMDIISIEKPELATRVFIAFSEYPWKKSVFQKYANDATLRADRMQLIMPSAWITSGNGVFGMKKGECGHAIVATAPDIDKVVEYQPSLKPALLSPPATAIKTDAEGRATDDSIWQQEGTRYPLHIRQASPQSASADLVKLMDRIGENASGKPYKPMMLALWDGVGIAHELAGFHNDPASMLLRFSGTQPLRVDAVQSIDSVERSVRSGAAQSESNWRKSLMSGLLSGDSGMGLITPGAQAMVEDAGQLTPEEKQAAGDKAWRKYTASIKGGKWPNAFSTWFDDVTKRCEDLQKQRVPDRDAWLKADTFRHALNDYDPTDGNDGLAFHGVIDEAFAGLPATAPGLRIVEELVGNMDPTDERSYFWRAFAYNQTDLRTDLKTFLDRVQAAKDETILGRAEAWYVANEAKLAIDLGYLKSFVKFYDKMDEVLKHEVPGSATERPIKFLQIDRLTVWAGRGFVNVLGPISKSLGGMLIKGALMIRGGLAFEDAKRITVKLAAWEGQMDGVLKVRMGEFRTQYPGAKDVEIRAKAYQAIANDERGALVRRLYGDAKLTPNATRDKANASLKLSGALFIIELMNYYFLWTKPNKTADDKLSIVSGTFSLMGAAMNVQSKWLGSFAKSGAFMTLANMKMASSCLGGMSSFISLWTDTGKAIAGQKSGNSKQAIFYTFKSFVDFVSGASAVLTAVSSSAPLLIRYTTLSPGKVRFLGKLSVSMAGAQARLEAKAAGLTAEELTASVRSAAVKASRTIVGETAAAELAAEVSAEGWLMISGRVLLIATGWEVALILTILTILYNLFTPNDLENWLSSCPFGNSPDPERTLEKQQTAFEAALAATGYKDGK
ncbi:hypothetical protein F4827_003826 [Paraburkholderia bannensis]|uniref:Toxin VasX N-terminal region domain-containing protein n=1 Tax=Paraburkholderia bannensis TaxID=765414 RepID=A0A7W9U0E3_9BURK|nr:MULTISPECIES: T6SS effector BTH_I2691 family protein [Paraburkholderia]MBB3258957.1 hypothetical protein [Paraburkholderia sp. WP4_3_2]MBB6103971.1 hypothetical protein [Paraburkholderia bannensis]